MSRTVLTDLDFGNAARPINLPAPVNPGDAVPRSFVTARTPQITVGTTAPSSPAVGDVWIDTN